MTRRKTAVRIRPTAKEETATHPGTRSSSTLSCDDALAIPNAEGLTDRERLFADHYREHFNGTRAYREAGYRAKNDNVAGVEASRLLRKPRVQAYLASRQRTAEARLDLSVDRTLQELARLAFYDPRRFFDASGNLLPIHLLDEDTARALAGVDALVTEAKPGRQSAPNMVLKKIRMTDKSSAIDKLMRYHSLYKDRLEVTDDFAQRLLRARERVKAGREKRLKGK